MVFSTSPVAHTPKHIQNMSHASQKVPHSVTSATPTATHTISQSCTPDNPEPVISPQQILQTPRRTSPRKHKPRDLMAEEISGSESVSFQTLS